MFVCPENEKGKTIYSQAFLKKLVAFYNKANKHEKIKSDGNLFKQLQQKMKKYGLDKKYWHWPYVIRKMNNTIDTSVITKYEKKELIPEKPSAWYSNPRTWLSNYDIHDVMVQYNACKKFKYCFLGVFPIDFSISSTDGTCLYNQFCHFDVKKYCKKYSFIGFITNLDKHDEPGSHWTSTFIVINPKLKSYGAYYYNSIGISYPSYLSGFLQNIQNQCNEMYPKHNFVINNNKKQHQYKNTECGVFSMVFQIRWLNKHIVKKNNTSFREILSNPYIDDENMLKLRDHLFRPNSGVELQKLKI